MGRSNSRNRSELPNMTKLTTERRELKILQALEIDELKRICNMKIEAVYGGAEQNVLQEFRCRLSRGHDYPERYAKMERWRKFYQKRYREIKYWIANLATKNQLENMNLTRNKYWTKATWQPHGSTEDFDSSLVPDVVLPTMPEAPK